MGVLSDDLRRVVDEQRLGFIATVNADGTPNLSPRGTLAVWNDDTLIFAAIRSPRTPRNLRSSPVVAIHVVDPMLPGGYCFAQGVAFYHERGVANPVRGGAGGSHTCAPADLACVRSGRE
jgi:hypothetical protein